MTDKELWEKYMIQNNLEHSEYEAWSFGVDADLLAKLVVNGEKTATSSAYPLYELENEPLPKEGEYSVILNSEGEAVCIILTKKVFIVPFHEITEEFAYKEGEGDKSLAYWKKVHEDFFTECLTASNLEFSYNLKVVCEEFEVVFKA